MDELTQADGRAVDPDASNDRPAAADRFIGDILGHLRRAEGLTLADLSAAVGVTAKQIEEIEAGETVISLALLFKIGLVLGVDVSDIVRSAGTYVQVKKGKVPKRYRSLNKNATLNEPENI